MVQFPWVNGNAESISTGYLLSLSNFLIFSASHFIPQALNCFISLLLLIPFPSSTVTIFVLFCFLHGFQRIKTLELPYPPIASEDNFGEHYFRFLIYFLLNTLVVYLLLKRHLFSSCAVLVTRLLKPLRCW